MARVKQPLMSLEAVGSIGGILRFRHDAQGVHVYCGGEPGRIAGKRTTRPQALQRAQYASACQAWNQLTADNQQLWSQWAKAAHLNYSGFSYYVQCYLTGLLPVSPVGLQPYPEMGLFLSLAGQGLREYPTAGLDFNW